MTDIFIISCHLNVFMRTLVTSMIQQFQVCKGLEPVLATINLCNKLQLHNILMPKISALGHVPVSTKIV